MNLMERLSRVSGRRMLMAGAVILALCLAGVVLNALEGAWAFVAIILSCAVIVSFCMTIIWSEGR